MTPYEQIVADIKAGLNDHPAVTIGSIEILIKSAAISFHNEMLMEMLHVNYNHQCANYSFRQKQEVIELVRKGWGFENAIKASVDDLNVTNDEITESTDRLLDEMTNDKKKGCGTCFHRTSTSGMPYCASCVDSSNYHQEGED